MENYEELFAKDTNHDNWEIFSEAKEFALKYHMMYQNKIIKVFLREYYNRYSILQKEVKRLIKPNYGVECQLRKEYRELLSWYEIWQPDEPNNKEDID
jgi:hypothetical protein